MHENISTSIHISYNGGLSITNNILMNFLKRQATYCDPDYNCTKGANILNI